MKWELQKLKQKESKKMIKNLEFFVAGAEKKFQNRNWKFQNNQKILIFVPTVEKLQKKLKVNNSPDFCFLKI